MQAELWRDGTRILEENRRLRENVYFRDEVAMILERAGFGDIKVEGGYKKRRQRRTTTSSSSSRDAHD